MSNINMETNTLMDFPKTVIDPKLIELQKEIVEFVTSIILQHEKEFYQLVEKHFPTQMEQILGTTSTSIIEMITQTTNKFYNSLYFDIQNNKSTNLTKLTSKMCALAEYGPHILLEKLINLTINIHYEVDREILALDNMEIYLQNVLAHINHYLSSHHFIHSFTKCLADDTPFTVVPAGQHPFDISFNIIVDKNQDPQ